MNVIDAAKAIKQYCIDIGAKTKCIGCPFNNNNYYCELEGFVPAQWDIEEREPISKDIQHVGYDEEQCGRTK